ncbi:MAG: site-specific integrase [Balneola sp.]
MKPSYALLARIDKKTEEGIIPIFLRVTYNRKKSLYFTGIKVHEKYWNPEKKEVRRNHTSYKTYNTELEDLVLRAQKIGFKLEKKKISARLIVKELKGINPEDVFKFAKGFCDRLERSGSIRRLKQTNVVLNKLRGMIDSDKLLFSEITPSFLEEFEIYLRKEVGNAQNTINKNMERLKMVFNDSVEKGIHNENPFDKYQIPTRQSSKKEALTIEQIRKIEELEIDIDDELFDIRNYFMFSFYNAGIRFGDICSLKWDNIQDGRLKYLMGKSSSTSNPKWKNIKLNEQSFEILGHYIRTNNESEFIFPLFDSSVDLNNYSEFDKAKASRNARVNLGLKKIRKLAGIDTNITFHISRHSFARHAATMGMNIYAISNALAHSNLKTTQGYLKSFDENLLDKEMENLF